MPFNFVNKEVNTSTMNISLRNKANDTVHCFEGNLHRCWFSPR